MKIKKLMLLTAIPFLMGGCSNGADTKVDFLIDDTDIKENIDRNTYSNSFSASQLSEQWANYGIGDPFVYRFNGMYYLYVSTANKQVGIRAYKSRDLISWTPCQGDGLEYGYVSNDPCTLTAYAPEVIYYNGTFYMAQSQGGQGHYMLESDSPEGPFVKTQDIFVTSIDGSFFIDDNEKIYLLNAGQSGIRIYDMKNDFTLGDNQKKIDAADIGGWTEGPYLLKKDGNYYLTFTGTHVTSPGYHIAYAYHSSIDETTFFKRDGFTYGKNIILNTSNEFNGLGHSSTVLGPNLDSYYIAYHSLESSAGPRRRFCINRLMFNGTDMSCEYYAKEGNIVPQSPEFTCENGDGLTMDGAFRLSNIASTNVFSSEYNFKGLDTQLIFNYVDSSNYYYVGFTTNKITVNKVNNGVSNTLKSYNFVNNYDFSKLHTVRLAYSEGNLDCYFDTMKFISINDLTLEGGKIGYKADKDNIFYTVLSNAAHDSSQKSDYKQKEIPINSFDTKYTTLTNSDLVTMDKTETNGIYGSKYLHFHDNKSATYKIYAKEDGYYGVDATLSQSSQGKKIKLRIDNESYTIFDINKVQVKDQDFITNIGAVAIKKGVHYLTIKGDDINIRNLSIYKTSSKAETFENNLSDFITKGATYVNVWKIKDNGHYALSGNRQLLYVGDSTIRDASIEVKIKFEGDTVANTAGVLLRGDNPAFALSSTEDSLQGFYVGINNSKIFIRECNYNQSTTGASDAITLASGVDHILKATIEGNTVKAYLNNELKLTYTTYFGMTHGHLGLYTNGAAAIYKDLKINVSK